MAKIEHTVTVAIDGTEYSVAQFSDSVKNAIALMDDWRQKEADLSSDILMVRGAIRDIQNSILAAINSELNPPNGGSAGDVGGESQVDTPAA
jgi:hypothetical protein